MISSKTETPENLKRMELCPRFGSCSVPKCSLDELIDRRVQLGSEPTCPYTTHLKSRRMRPIPRQIRKFLRPDETGGFKSVFEEVSPEARK